MIPFALLCIAVYYLFGFFLGDYTLYEKIVVATLLWLSVAIMNIKEDYKEPVRINGGNELDKLNKMYEELSPGLKKDNPLKMKLDRINKLHEENMYIIHRMKK